MERTSSRRASFTDQQIVNMTNMYEQTANRGYPTQQEMVNMATFLAIPIKRVRFWVKNRRGRERRAVREMPLNAQR